MSTTTEAALVATEMAASNAANAAKNKKKTKDEAWVKHPAKLVLKKALVQGQVSLDGRKENAKKVWDKFKHLPEFQDLKYNALFRSRLSGLRQYVRERVPQSDWDDKAVARSRRMTPKARPEANGKPRWDGSPAQALLIKDIDQRKHYRMTAYQLYKSNDAYQVFSLTVFRNHIYKEVRIRLFRNQFKDKNEKKYRK